MYIIGKSYNSNQYFDIMYQKYKNKCDWLTFFDFDEYLVLHFEEGKTLKLKEFLSNKNFEKCEAIEFNWLMYGDNNLVYYDNRTSLERFTKPDYNNSANKFVKSMVRGHLNKTIYRAYESCHKPDKNVLICDSKGDIPKFNRDSLEPPLFKYAYLIHFNTRTAEEYVQKVKRGYPGNNYPSYEERVDLFFTHNKFTEEKLKVFEKAFNQTFGKYHNQYKNLDLNDIISILNYILKF